MTDQAWSLGIDGGASRWKWAAEASDHREEGELPGANPNEMSWEAWLTHLGEVIQDVRVQLGLHEQNLDSMGLGMAGIGRIEQEAHLRSWLAQRFPALRRVWVGSDARPVLVASSGQRQGIVLLAGTGSLAWGCTAEGQVARAGGWGAAWGDEGSGYWIGRRAIERATRMADGRRPRTLLLDQILKQLSLEAPEALIAWARERSPSEVKRDVAALAPMILQMAESGERTARSISAAAQAHLLLMVRSVETQLQQFEASAKNRTAVIPPSPPPRPLVLGGSLWLHPGRVDRFRESLIKLGLNHLEVGPARGSAAWGALRLGQEASAS